jgi:amino acid adenylation domain-containing protein
LQDAIAVDGTPPPRSNSPEQQTFSAERGTDSGTVTEAVKAGDVAQDLNELQPEGSVDSQLTSGGALPSFAQQRLWFVSRLRAGSTAYHVPAALRLTGRLDAAVAERSLREVVRRHEALRTVFRMVGGQLIQVVLPDVPCSLPIVDLSHLPPVDRAAEAARRAAVEFRRAFDLERGPLLRAGLLRLGAEDHLLWLEIHHIASDGWSMGILLQDFAAVYAAFLRGEPSPLPPLALRYADYAAGQRARMQGETLREHLTYWKQQLDGLAESLELPTDRPRPVESALRGGTRFFSLPLALTEALESLGRREVTWLFMTLLAGFQALLQRYTSQNDIAVGTPVADRPRRELHKMIGCFLNVVVLRTDLSGDPSFRELLRRVRTMALRAYAHQELPFERLVEELRPARLPGRQPLIQVMFTLLNDPTKGMALPGLKVAPIAVDCGAAHYDLTLTMTRTEAGLDGAFEYDSDLFDAATIDRMIGHFKVLLGAVVADPDRRLSDLPLLTDAERQQLLVDWNDTRAEYPRERCVHELFQEQAARTPAAVAVAGGGVTLTYAELNRRANRLAHRLQALGVGPESLVGLYAERTPGMVVGLLGILKAGGAYVPLDPSYPTERLAFMLEDAAAPFVLTERRLAASLPASSARHVLLDADAEAIARHSDDNPDSGATPDNLAYVPYTSGSTGKPKGALILHRGLVNYLHWATEAYEVAKGTGAHLHSPLGYDLTVTSLFPALLAGRTVFVLPEGGGVESLSTALRRDGGCSLVRLTPSHLQMLSSMVPAREAAGRTAAFVIGGEVLSAESLALWRRHAPRTRLIKEYGPTETGVGCVYEVSADTPATGPVPIGRPIANTRVYVLDERMQPVPVGVPGELYIGGAGVCRGYWRRPDLTAAKFVRDPFATEAGARLYRTGDRVRWRTDGHLEFLGRLDDQVTPNGQVDRAALPAPDRAESRGPRAAVPPMDETEAKLALLWREALGEESVSATKSFFDSGGSSLLAMSLLARVERTFGRKLSLARFFQAPTIEALAAVLRGTDTGPQASAPWGLVEIQSGNTKPPLFLVHSVGGQVIYYSPLASYLGPDQPIYAFQQLEPCTEVHKSNASIEAMAASYVEKLLTVQPKEPFLLAGHSFGGFVALEMAQQLISKGHRVALLAIIDTPAHTPTEWSARRLWGFLQNFLQWLRYGFFSRTPSQHYTLFLRLFRRFKRKMAKMLGHPPARSLEEAVAEHLAAMGVPERVRAFCEGNLLVSLKYRAQTYPGPATLFRAQAQPLFSQHDTDMGWKNLVAGGLTIRVIPGTHDTLLKEPYVKALAEEFTAALSAAWASVCQPSRPGSRAEMKSSPPRERLRA